VHLPRGVFELTLKKKRHYTPISGRLANSESAEMTESRPRQRHTHWLLGRKIEIYAAKNNWTMV